MTEKLFHYLWQFQYFDKKELQTITGEEVIIIFPGTLNTNQGPDFKDAKIKIGSTLLAGSVELHINASDWQKHGHDGDGNYKNVILHVVFNNDVSQSALPVLELQHRIPKLLLEKYASFMEAAAFIPCAATINTVQHLVWVSFKERLVAERLTRKAQNIFNILKETNGHWEETFWRVLARNFGMKVNGDAFERIATNIPVTLLARHKNSIHQLEALLLGQAGLLTGNFIEDYPKLLQREYHFLEKKYHLKPLQIPVLFLRMRPYSFPTIRLAQLAMLLYQSTHLFSKILEASDVKSVQALFTVTANDYWHYHLRLEEPTAFKEKKIGADMIDNVMINTVVPVLFAYGLYKNDEQYKAKAVQWLETIAAEKNTIVAGFAKNAVRLSSAYDSQGFIELKNEYCNNKRCLE